MKLRTEQQQQEQLRRQQRWYTRNKEEHNAKTRARYNAHRMAALQAYGSKCACCPEANTEFLCIDHVKGGGNKERKARREGVGGFFRRLKREGFPNTYRVLCHNCNFSYGLLGYCPHQLTKTYEAGILSFI